MAGYTVFSQVLERDGCNWTKIAAAETDDNDKPKKISKIEKIEIIKTMTSANSLLPKTNKGGNQYDYLRI